MIDIDDLLNEKEAMDLSSMLKGERQDCAVVAVALATGKGYDEIHAMFKNRGRRSRCAVRDVVVDQVLRALNVKVTRDFRYSESKTINSLEKDIAEEDKTNTYLVKTRGHILCVKGGIPLDWTRGRRQRVQCVWKVDIEQEA